MAKRKKPVASDDRFKSANKPAANASNDAGVRPVEPAASAPPPKAPPRAGKAKARVASPPPEVASLAPPPLRSTLESEGVTSEPDPVPAVVAQGSTAPASGSAQPEGNSQALTASSPEPEASKPEPEASSPEPQASTPEPEPTSSAAEAITTEQESAAPESERAYAAADPYERIASRAYELYEGRGSGHGSDLEDWLEAERQVVRPADKPTDE